MIAMPLHDTAVPTLSRFAAMPAWLACAIAALAGLGYLTGNATLIRFQAGWSAMAPVTALCIAALAVPFIPARPMRATRYLAMSVAALAAAILASHLVYRSDIINPALERLFAMAPGLAARSSVATCLCLLLLAGATLARARRRIASLEWCANGAMLVSGSALLGYAYNISDLYSYYIFNTMALPTALALFCLSLSMLLSEPDSRLGMAVRAPQSSGIGARHLLVLAAFPALAGWILLQTGARTAGGDSFAMALLVMVTTIPMFYLLLEYARTVELLNRTRDAQAGAQAAQAVDLARQVSDVTAQLAMTHQREVSSLAQVERAKRSEAIAQLTGSIAHDFNNLLMVIGGSAQLMKLQLPGGHALLRHADKINATVTAAARLTGKLAAFSRTQRLDAEPLEIDAAVRAAIAEQAGLLPDGVRLVQHLDAANGWVLGDRAQLQLALSHLLRNAGEALGSGGTLRIATSIHPSETREGNDSVMIHIHDDGCGMSPEVMANALEPFFTTKPDGQHQGLGLAQASSVVHQASGSLHLSGSPGTGTQVDICLPRYTLQTRPLVSRTAPPAAAPAGAVNRRLLVIDDDQEVRDVIVALLRSMHYDVMEAHDGASGLRMLEHMQPALAIVDYLMPGMHGGEVARKARERYPDLPILFISGYADSEAIAAIPHARLLRKPILPEALGQAVAQAIAASRNDVRA
jgi:signal transduction histidine kinase